MASTIREKEREVSLYKVGGAVRDQLLGRRPHDVDFAVEAPSFGIMRSFVTANGCEVLTEAPQFVTLKARLRRGLVADFVLCRKESAYRDGRRPDRVEGGGIADDLARRDFTMNAMAIPCAFKDGDIVECGPLMDPHGGRAHLERKVLCCVGRATERFAEDGLRLLRALRFCLALGLEPAPDVAKCLAEADSARDFKGVSAERIRDELEK